MLASNVILLLHIILKAKVLYTSFFFKLPQINASSTEDGLNFYDSGHRFEHLQLLLVLLRSLPCASRAFQSRALQVCLSEFIDLKFCFLWCLS